MAYIEKRTSKDGTVSYRALVRIKGHPTESATFPQKKKAEEWAQQTEVAIKNGKYAITQESKRRTLGELIDKYKAEVLSKKQKVPKYVFNHFDVWKKLLGKYSLIAIKSDIITKALNEIAAIPTPKGGKKTPATLNRYIASLSVVFSYAYKNLDWIEINPMTKIKKYQESQGRIRYLELPEIERLIAAAKASVNPILYPVVITALTTGARRNEIANLQWVDVDLHIGENKGVATLHETKNHTRRTLIIKDPALSALRELEKTHGNAKYVFRRKNGADRPANFVASWYKALRDAEIENFRFHDLRHTFASHYMMNGGKLSDLSELLGHKDIKMTMRYSHLSNHYKHDTVDNVMGALFATMKSE